jgi:hypothetical protein
MAAKKARYYQVDVRDGHGVKSFVLPAFSKADVNVSFQVPGSDQPKATLNKPSISKTLTAA